MNVLLLCKWIKSRWTFGHHFYFMMWQLHFSACQLLMCCIHHWEKWGKWEAPSRKTEQFVLSFHIENIRSDDESIGHVNVFFSSPPSYILQVVNLPCEFMLFQHYHIHIWHVVVIYMYNMHINTSVSVLTKCFQVGQKCLLFKMMIMILYFLCHLCRSPELLWNRRQFRTNSCECKARESWRRWRYGR